MEIQSTIVVGACDGIKLVSLSKDSRRELNHIRLTVHDVDQCGVRGGSV